MPCSSFLLHERFFGEYAQAHLSPNKEEPKCYSLKSLWANGAHLGEGGGNSFRGLQINKTFSDETYSLPSLPPLMHPAPKPAPALSAPAAASSADADVSLILLIADALVRGGDPSTIKYAHIIFSYSTR